MSSVTAVRLKEMPIPTYPQRGGPEAKLGQAQRPGCAITAYLQGVALPQPQLLFVVVHSPAVVLHVSQGGGQGHMDDSQLRPWPAQLLCKIQLGTR